MSAVSVSPLPVHTISFEPFKITGSVQSGTTIQEAAQDLGVYLENICHGRGVCGKCKVRILEGRRNTSLPTTLETRTLSREELTQGYRLACQADISGNISVSVPTVSVRCGQVIRKSLEGREYMVDPAVRLFPLDVSPPSLQDQRSYCLRIGAALREQHGVEVRYIEYSVLKQAPKILRESTWRIEAVVRSDGRVLRIAPRGSTVLFGLAVDVGTTTIAGYLVDLREGRIRATHALMNPQVAFGEDVMSRIASCDIDPDGCRNLHRLALDALHEILSNTTRQVSIAENEVFEIVVVGNTCMHHLVLGLDPGSLGRSPFTPVASEAYALPVSILDTSFPPSASLFMLPTIGGFVGADTVGVLLATDAGNSNANHLIIDIGTNGELVLAAGSRLFACSVATGPAFEGAHISCGMRAAPGAIEQLSIAPDGEVNFAVIGNEKPKGICGSGIISAVAILFTANIIDRMGAFNSSLKNPRLRKGSAGMEYVLCRPEETASGTAITITRKDVENVQMAKAALYAGAKILMRKARISTLDRITLAGAFGTFIDSRAAYQIGMFPDTAPDVVSSVGNAAGDGAVMALLSQEVRSQASVLASRVEYAELSLDPDFQHEFAMALVLPHMRDTFTRHTKEDHR